MTVFAAQVTDDDTDDPPDNMDSDATFDFDTVAAAPPAGSDLIITGVIDGPLSGGTPKAIEVYALNDVADLSLYGLGSANNGGGSDGEEFTFPADSASAGDFIYVASESPQFTAWFGFAPNYTAGAASINGDDAIELFHNGSVADVFGDINVDGNGEPWEYLDGWAYRVDGTGPDGSTFVLANWTFSGANALDGEVDNGSAASPFPVASYAPPAPPLILTGVIDGPLSGGTPKAIEIYVGQNIADLSIYGLGSANNGGGTDGEEFTFPADSASAGDFIYVASESLQFTAWFGFAPNYTAGAASINGDDAIELFQNGSVIDVFGDIGVDGNGEPWEYLDGWAYRVDGTGPDGSTFVLGNWTFSGANALDGESDNGSAASPFPVGTYTFSGGADVAPTVSSSTPADGATLVAVDANIDINFSEDVTVTGSWFDINCTSSGVHTAVAAGGPSAFTLDPDVDFDSGESCTVTVVASQVADQDGTADNMAADFVFNFDTLVVEVCGDPFTAIHDIQGAGLASPLDGSLVSTEGIVTATFFGVDEIGGFFMQAADADVDADPNTSEGIYVFTTFFTDPVAGDTVRVSGDVDEFFDLTEITNVNNVLVCSSGGSVTATAVDLPVTGPDDLEAYEGMFVTFPETLYVTDNFNWHRFGEIVLSEGDRQINPTNAIAPGPGAGDTDGDNVADINENGRILVDDGRSAQFPDPPPNLGPGGTIRLGDSVTGMSGVLSYSFGNYRVQPTDITVVRDNPRQATPTDFGGDVRVASVNVLNYWTTIDNGSNNARGADSAAEFERQQDKLVAEILLLDADIIGLQELEANGSTAIGNLVDALNDATAPGTWAFVADPAYPGGLDSVNAIKVGIIYQPASVTPVGASVADDDLAFAEDRPPVAQAFDYNGEIFTVIVNHFKSKGCSGSTGADVDQNDGQACYNGRRTDQALALIDFVAELQALSGDDDVLVIGDLNSYTMEDPITTLGNSLVNQTLNHVAAEDRYSFVFFGQAGLLDHAFSTDSLDNHVTGVEVWHINADEPRALSYNDEIIDSAENSSNLEQDSLYNPDQYRSSDHDPVIVTLDFGLISNSDGCYVLEIDGSPHVGAATIVDYNLPGATFKARLFASANGLPRNNSCFEIHGTDYSERLFGDKLGDTIYGYGGDDRLFGDSGNDFFIGGSGSDRMIGNGGFDTVLDYEPGIDFCSAESGC